MPKNDTIFKRLKQATEAERKSICEILDLEDKYKNNIDEISKEFRSVSGNSIANTLRDEQALEYIEILKDTYFGLETGIDKKLKKLYFKNNFDKNVATEYELENEIKILINKVSQSIHETNPNNVSEILRKEIISCGKTDSGVEAVLGGGGLGIVARLISLPISIGVTAVQTVSTPTYRKTYQVVLKLIHVKQRIRAEEKLKD